MLFVILLFSLLVFFAFCLGTSIGKYLKSEAQDEKFYRDLHKKLKERGE
jgi:Na+-transporting methylmalonyl-CoA/oxaloacetate decarboxylase gamma subunit